MKNKEIDRIRSALQKLLPKAKGWNGVGYRSASTKYANTSDLVTGIGSKIACGRWNPKGLFLTVYLSVELDTAFKESFAHFSYYGFKLYEALPRTFVAVSLKLHRVLDLTDSNILRRLRISRRSLLNLDWRKIQDRGRVAFTQAIGKLAFELGVEGIMAPSSAAKDGTTW